VRVDDEAGQGLGVEIGRLLRHQVAVARHCLDRLDRGRLEQDRRIDLVARRHGCDGFVDRLGEADPSGLDSILVDARESVERDPQQRDIERPEGLPTVRQPRLEALAPRGQDRPADASPQAETTTPADPGRAAERSRQVRTRGDRLDLEQRGRRGEQASGSLVAEAAQKAVCRQHRQLLACRLEQQCEQVIERWILLAGTAHPPLVPIAQGRFVAVVAIGDGDRRCLARAEDRIGHDRHRAIPVGDDGPESMANTVGVDELHLWASGGDRGQRLQDVTAGVVEQADHGTGVDPGRAEQLVAVLAGCRQGPFVAHHPAARVERLQPQPGEIPALRPLDVAAREAIGLLVDVDRRMRVLAQRPIRAPGGQGPCRPPIAVVRSVTGLVGG
jgi:hypothetical protein